MQLTDYRSSDLQNDKVLVVGLPKSGKSTLVSELSKEFKLHWIDTERGVRTLTKLPPEQQKNIDIYILPDSAAYPIAAETLLILFKTGKMNICPEHGKHECAVCKKNPEIKFQSLDFSTLTSNDIVVLDSVTQLGRSILAHTTKSKPVDYKPERDDWGALRKYTEFFASQFQAAYYNLVCISHAVETELEDGKTKLVPEFGSKGMSASFAKAFDHVIYCDTKNNKHVSGSMTNYSMGVLTGSRTDFDITKEVTPSLLPIFRRTPKSA